MTSFVKSAPEENDFIADSILFHKENFYTIVHNMLLLLLAKQQLILLFLSLCVMEVAHVRDLLICFEGVGWGRKRVYDGVFVCLLHFFDFISSRERI
jgi:hypothetical protein